MQTLTSFPAERKALVGNSGLLCLDFPDPLERGSQDCSIYLGSALNSRGSPLVWQLLLVTSSNASMPTFSRHHLRVSSTPQHILHTNTIQNTSLPTKCLHRADLQHNDFLVPVIEALKDVYESQPDVLRCYVRCRGTGSRVEKMEKPFPQSVMCSIPSNPGPEGGAHMGWGKGKLLFTLEMEVC